MRANFKGKVISGRLAEVFVSRKLATELEDGKIPVKANKIAKPKPKTVKKVKK